MKNYELHPEFLLRSPLFPVRVLEDLYALGEEALMEGRLRELWNTLPYFRESVWLSSPGLHERMQDWVSGAPGADSGLALTALKYLIRACTRATPFGLLAGNSIGSWGKSGNLVVPGPDGLRRHTTLNGGVTFRLAEQFQQVAEVQDRIRWHFNNSLYRYGDRFRFLRWFTAGDGKQKFEVSSVSCTPHLELLMESCPVGTLAEMSRVLEDAYEVGPEEAREFLSGLIAEQIVRSELDPPIVGRQHLDHLLEVLGKRAGESEECRWVEQVVRQLQALDGAGIRSDFEPAYRDLNRLVEAKGGTSRGRSLFHVESYRPLGEQNRLPYRIPGQLRKGLEALGRLSPPAPPANRNIRDFAEKFTRRYEYREVPLMEVLDPDLGLGYGGNSTLKNDLPLMEGAERAPSRRRSNREIPWNNTNTLLLRKLLAIRANGDDRITLTDADLEHLRPADWDSFPATLRVSLSLVEQAGQPGNPTLFLEGTGDIAPTNIISRFGLAYDEARHFEESLLAVEEAHCGDGLLVEFNYVPEDAEIFCILARSTRRSHTLSFMARADLPEEQRLSVEDIMVRVEGGEVILRSKSLNKRLYPRITTAHNFSRKTHPICEFIGELQAQRLQSRLHLDWGPLVSSYQHLPRVYYRDILLSAAQWHFFEELAAPLRQKNVDDATLLAFVREQGLPDRVVTSEYDKTLVLDLRTRMGRRLLAEAVPKSGAFRVKEYLPPSGWVATSAGEAHAHQIQAYFTRKVMVSQPHKDRSADSFSPVRPENFAAHTFLPGSEWVYFKAYGAAKPLEEWFLGDVLPVLAELEQEGVVDRWFFLRFTDPDFHFRIRLHLSDTGHFARVVQQLNALALPEMELGRLRTLQLDAYVRETERYGEEAIALMERAFSVDSLFTGYVLHALGLSRIDEQRRWMVILAMLDQLLAAAGYSLSEQVDLLRKYPSGREDARHAAARFKQHHSAIEQLLRREEEGQQALYNLLDHRGKAMEQALAPLKALWPDRSHPRFENCVLNLLHLCVNRAALENPVGQERVLLRMLFNLKQKMLHQKDEKSHAY